MDRATLIVPPSGVARRRLSGPSPLSRRITRCACAVGDETDLVIDRAPRKTDPTGLSAARSRWEREVVRRFGALKRAIRQAIVDLDVLGLKGPSVAGTSLDLLFSNGRRDGVIRDAITPPVEGQFAFQRAAAKVESFGQWLKDAAREGILEVQFGTSLSQAANASWQNVYLDTAYKKGMRDAYSRLGQGPLLAGFNSPVHADATALIYTRAYRALEGVTEVMDAQMSAALARAMVEGKGAMDTARALMDRVDAIGIVRAKTIARTEMTAAYAEATLNSYEEAGVEGVEVEAEVATAGDEQVCPECEDLEGKVFEISEARGLLPVHPNCRCALLPVVKE